MGIMKNKKGYGSIQKRRSTDTHIECRSCLLMKEYSEFHKDTSKYGVGYYCKKCANEKSRNHHKRRMLEDSEYRLKMRDRYLKHSHGITANQYEALLEAQGYLCAICGVKLSARGHNTHYDHCHKTGKHRQFLCTNCNRGLGHFQDSVENLQKAIDYLNSHSENGTHKEVTMDASPN